MRFLSAFLFFASVVIGQCGVAHSATVSWLVAGGQSSFTGQDEIEFAPFYSNKLVSVGGLPFFRVNSGPDPVTFELALKLDNVWTPVFTAVTSSSVRIPSNTLSNILTNIMFPGADVTGMRMGTSPDPNGSVVVGSQTIFTFTFDVSPVPVPAALPLFATALAGAGIFRWRRKRAASSR